MSKEETEVILSYPKMKKVDLSNVDPTLDGVEHTRVDRQAKTHLGRNMVIDIPRVFHHPQYGSFVSVYAAVNWYKLRDKDEVIRQLNGIELREYLTKKEEELGESPFIKKFVPDDIMETFLIYSILSSPSLLEEYLKNDKPFVAYYFDEEGLFRMRDKQLTRVLNKLKPKLINRTASL